MLNCVFKSCSLPEQNDSPLNRSLFSDVSSFDADRFA